MSASAEQPFRIGVDTGGTFTDLVAVDTRDGSERKVKVPSTPRDPSAAVLEGVGRLGIPLDEVGFFILGTTIATNCLLQRRGQRTVYLTTAGLEDVPFIQRIDRKGLHNLQWAKPTPYVLRRDCFGVDERVLYDGTVRRPLSEADVAAAVAFVRQRDAETPGGVSVAINLLFSYVEPRHEQQLAEAVRRELPTVPVSISSEVAPIWREYERGNTVIVDAYLRRLIGEFAVSLQAGLEGLGMRSRCFFLKSNGGQVAAEAVDPPARQPDPLRPGRRAHRRQALRGRHRLAGRLHARHGRHQRRRRRHHRRARPQPGAVRVRVGPADRGADRRPLDHRGRRQLDRRLRLRRLPQGRPRERRRRPRPDGLRQGR